MKKRNGCLGGIGLIVITVISIVFLFMSILIFGEYFVKNYGDIQKRYSSLGINDIIIFTVYIVQLAVTGILSFMVYRLSKSNEERVIYNEKLDKKSALKHIKNEINYNKSMLQVLKLKNVDMNRVNKYLFKTEAWDKYSIILVELLESKEYNVILSYYSIIQLYSIKELQEDIINTINNTDELLIILKNAIKQLG